eukprot:365428-Chlamydomonas_euryale.AAC.10
MHCALTACLRRCRYELYGGAPFRRDDGGRVFDRAGTQVKLMGATANVLLELATDPKWKGTQASAAGCASSAVVREWGGRPVWWLCLYQCVCVWLSFTHPPVRPSIHSSIHPSIYPSIHPSIHACM